MVQNYLSAFQNPGELERSTVGFFIQVIVREE